MRDLGAIIFLLFIVGQGVAAVVASLKKRQAKAAEEQAAEMSIDKKRDGPISTQTETQARMPVESRSESMKDLERPPMTRPVKATSVEPTQVKVTSRREEFIARRREQIEELRELARARTERASTGTPKQPQGRPATPAPAKAPPRQRPVVLKPVVQPEPVSAVPEPEASASEDFWATKPGKRRVRRGRGIHRAVRSRARLRELVILKEVLEPPLALRKDPFASD